MLSYIKSLMAVGLALLVVIGAGLWLQGRVRVLKTLEKEERNVERQVTEARGYFAIILNLKRRLESLHQDTADITRRFAQKNREGPQLIRAVVTAASGSNMEMIGVAETVSKGKLQLVNDLPAGVKITSHEISLKGTYTGLVKFLQTLASWKLENKIESLEVVPLEELESDGDVMVDLALSIFSGEI